MTTMKIQARKGLKAFKCCHKILEELFKFANRISTEGAQSYRVCIALAVLQSSSGSQV